MGVPARYIKDAPVDWIGEIWAFSGGHVVIGDVQVDQPSIGVWSLLEMADCDFDHPAKKPTVFGAMLAFYIMSQKSKCVDDVWQWVRDGRDKLEEPTIPYHQFEIKVMEHGIKHRLSTEHFGIIRRMLDLSFSGYSMIPASGGSSSQWVYSAETLASVIAVVGDLLGVPWHSVIWDVPMCVAGHVSAQKARRSGVNGVARPKDKADIKRQLAAFNQRVKEGKLHPWQEQYPLEYGRLGHESYTEEYRLGELTAAAIQERDKGMKNG